MLYLILFNQKDYFMKRHYLTLLLLLFTSLQFAHSQNVCIEPKNVNDAEITLHSPHLKQILLDCASL